MYRGVRKKFLFQNSYQCSGFEKVWVFLLFCVMTFARITLQYPLEILLISVYNENCLQIPILETPGNAEKFRNTTEHSRNLRDTFFLLITPSNVCHCILFLFLELLFSLKVKTSFNFIVTTYADQRIINFVGNFVKYTLTLFYESAFFFSVLIFIFNLGKDLLI